MASRNRLSKTLAKFDLLPAILRRRAVTLVMGHMVPFVGTAALTIEEMTGERVVVFAPNRRSNRNHIGSIHAATMTLAAETASGFVVAMNVPDDKIPLVKSLKVEFKKRSRGALRAVSTLTPEQQEKIRTSERGNVLVETHATDESGTEPILCEMIWAWVPKKP